MRHSSRPELFCVQDLSPEPHTMSLCSENWLGCPPFHVLFPCLMILGVPASLLWSLPLHPVSCSFFRAEVAVDRTGGAACKGMSVSTLQPTLGHLDSKPSSKSSMLRGRNSATSADEQPHIGNYRLLKTIGKGNFAKVKLARHILTGKEVSSGIGAMVAAPVFGQC